MKRLTGKRMTPESADYDGGLVHLPGELLSGLHTLCGWCDTHRWCDCDEPITCGGCLAVFDYIKGSTIKRKRK